MSDAPETKYARTDDGIHIAYQIVGDGPPDFVWIPAPFYHLDVMWEHPYGVRYAQRLAAFSRTTCQEC
jgi:hypothetical protein